ncbi:hypothetical protein [Nocardia sp. NPDC052566]|uniref:hypothetical protein n=1 Tax=Nocardia sp. NPDC052566 TaxID=3364330 RepID=UPI0037C939BC
MSEFEHDEHDPAYLLGRYEAIARRIIADSAGHSLSVAAQTLREWLNATEIPAQAIADFRRQLEADLHAIVDRHGKATMAYYQTMLDELTFAMPPQRVSLSTTHARRRRRLGYEHQWFAVPQRPVPRTLDH